LYLDGLLLSDRLLFSDGFSEVSLYREIASNASIYSKIGSQPGVFVSIYILVPIRLIVSIRALLYAVPCFCPPSAHIFHFSYAHPYIMQRLVNGSTDSSMIAERFTLQ